MFFLVVTGRAAVRSSPVAPVAAVRSLSGVYPPAMILQVVLSLEQFPTVVTGKVATPLLVDDPVAFQVVSVLEPLSARLAGVITNL